MITVDYRAKALAKAVSGALAEELERTRFTRHDRGIE